ncbi:MAG: SMC-Scp complex subunit ScpB, partial [Candidatus Nitrosopolaris sp.]
YEQPVSSKRLMQIRGSQVYAHLRTLKQMGFIELEQLGRSKTYRTTKKFRSYFGVTDLESLRNSLATTSKNQSKNNKLTQRNNLMIAATASPMEEAERS